MGTIEGKDKEVSMAENFQEHQNDEEDKVEKWRLFLIV